MTAVTENDLKRLEELIIGIANGQKVLENRFTNIENRLTHVETRLTHVETRLTHVETRLTVIEEGQNRINNDIHDLKIGQVEIRGEIRTLDARIDSLTERIKPIEIAVTKIPDLAEKVGEVKN